MIWIGHAMGGFHWHGKAIVDGMCYCADCIVERSGGLLAVGDLNEKHKRELRDLQRKGYVGLYRVMRKPWKERG